MSLVPALTPALGAAVGRFQHCPQTESVVLPVLLDGQAVPQSEVRRRWC